MRRQRPSAQWFARQRGKITIGRMRGHHVALREWHHVFFQMTKSKRFLGTSFLLWLLFYTLSISQFTAATPIPSQLQSLLSGHHSPSLASAPHSTSLNELFDAIYVIGLSRCATRSKLIAAWASTHNVTLTRIPAVSYSEVDLIHPPLPVINLPGGAHATAGQVACTASHMRVWRHAHMHKHKQILVLEDDVHLTSSLLSRLPSIIKHANAGSAQRNWQPWHYIYLRAYTTRVSAPLMRWSGFLRVARPSWGTAAYVASAAGVQFFLTRLAKYSHPLDVQIERFQKGFDCEGANFVALDGCAFTMWGTYGCPENSRELSRKEKAECAYSASQAGGRRPARAFPAFLKG